MSQKSHFGNTSEQSVWRPEVPYNDLPLIPPSIDLETRPVLKRCVGARAALAELKQAAAPKSDDPHQHATAARGPGEFGNRAHRHHH
jgi:hypothetical protein